MTSKFIPNSFQIPNVVVDELMGELTGAELKCYLYVVRKTTGWHKEFDAISISQFANACKLTNKTVIAACDHLVQLGLLKQKTGRNNVKIFSVASYFLPTENSGQVVEKVHDLTKTSSVKTPLPSSGKITPQVVEFLHTQTNTIQTNNNKKHPPLIPPRGASVQDGTDEAVVFDERGLADAKGVALPNTSEQRSPRSVKRSPAEQPSEQGSLDENFERFWNAGMRKINRAKAVAVFKRVAKAWLTQRPEQTLADFTAMVVADIQTRVQRGVFGFDKLHPATYLNGARWEDELPTTVAQPAPITSPAHNGFSERTYTVSDKWDKFPAWLYDSEEDRQRAIREFNEQQAKGGAK